MSLFDSSNKGAKFAEIGDEITGTITSEPTERQQTKFGTQEPDFWPNGDPKMQIVVNLQTSLREDANDDGARTLYVASKNMKRSISDAIRAANVADVARGGVLTVKYIGNDPNSKNPANPAKLYAASYTPPASAFTAQSAPPAAQAPAAAAPPPVPAPAAAAPQAAPGGLTQEQAGKLAQLRAAGIDEATIATAIGATPEQIAVFDQTPF